MNAISAIRSNWKKTVFGLGLGAYGINYGHEWYQISSLMKSYSEKAVQYGDRCDVYPRKLIVILNPAANKKKAEKTFQKYCEPILHLAGFTVDIVRTDSEGHAKTYVEQLKSVPYGIVIAGGDGSVSEVLTGLMRRNTDHCPIALLPLGSKNETTKKMLNINWDSKVNEVEALLNASLNIARETLEKKSIFKIEQIATESDEQQPAGRPIFSMGSLDWGIFRDIESLQSKYWYFWRADKYIGALINSFNSKLTWECKADVCYTTPCIGCNNCLVHNEVVAQSQKSIFSRLFSRQLVSNSSKIVPMSDVECEQHNQQINASNIRIHVDNDKTSDNNKLVLESDKKIETGFDTFSKYLSEEKVFEMLKFRTMNFIPDGSCTGESRVYSIDGEAYDVRPIKVTLVPKAVEIFV
ncbi:acylglycerol kinase, mitochondrial [Episyrphus balteatus]|uniref:acylglycerol kinase, mitochondrial n=1 Tax=Episyrphus balteatus TaxID=286459 RepID=UPI0024869FAC|nr:acylglycerol kinase, mitochondrial [Episyrphus balteatus]